MRWRIVGCLKDIFLKCIFLKNDVFDQIVVFITVGVVADNCFGVERIFCPDFPKFARKAFVR